MKHLDGSTVGGYAEIDGEEFYRIQNFDLMEHFFISLVSHSNHWFFISTSGALTAGRTNSESALFPYYTEDKILDSARVTGHRAVFFIVDEGRQYYWEPFALHFDGLYRVERNLYKDELGTTLIFEEINFDLDVRYRYRWQTAHRFGFIKRSSLANHGSRTRCIRLLDGIENILPYGASPGIQNELSCLVDAYKKNELDVGSGVATYSMSSLLTDRAEPSEGLSATVAWSYGLASPQHLLCSSQVELFRRGFEVALEEDVHGRRGAYFVSDSLTLDAGVERGWSIVADVNQGPADVANLIQQISRDREIGSSVQRDIATGRSRLGEIVGSADGFQSTSERLSTAHHTANVMFNAMRGGIFDRNYLLSKADLIEFCGAWNKNAGPKIQVLTADMPEGIDYLVLRERIWTEGSLQLCRLFLEYLPLTFSRRHGDPSRPWNHFSIDVLDEQGGKRLSFAGNWRDIFQNWEALSAATPGYVENIICKFVSATTADGYNPYRITREGIDWERPEADNPWANIGYWGDHQIIYLLKLLELAQSHFPTALSSLLSSDFFAYANVPYRIKDFDALLADPHNTITFDYKLDAAISLRVSETGADGRLLWVGEQVYQVNLLEKLLVTGLAKLTNFIPGGGIWMNTQRPEWNDANNALVGTGVSVVTLCYLYRFFTVMRGLLFGAADHSIPVSREVVCLFDGVYGVLEEKGAALVTGAVTDTLRFEVMEQLGRVGEAYREGIYDRGLSGERLQLSMETIKKFVALIQPILGSSIAENRRDDALYHAYHRVQIVGAQGRLIRLDEMLEGQVAVLSAGVLSPQESLRLLGALRESALYTPRQHSYLLYPNKTLLRFVDKNQLSPEVVSQIPILQQLMAEGHAHLIETDEQGGAHFNGALTKVDDVDAELTRLTGSGFAFSEAERSQVRDLFIHTFRHDLFTGRSGGMYAYEGLGSIYWHMVSKLLLAVSETIIAGHRSGTDSQTLSALISAYEDIRAGIGFNKTPDVYGAFPTDPYSHTPGFAGARQPGMTGQVKEEILTRLPELGLTVDQGSLLFDSILLRKQEFHSAPAILRYVDIAFTEQEIALEAGQLGFTICQVPVILEKADTASITVYGADGSESTFSSRRLPKMLSYSIFMKRGEISQMNVSLPV
ncbi:MAG: hypothetical protein P8M73_04825 [Luminiphilus sp.]|nr:hypothetical protein [Luminiphilus sp.]